MEFEWDENKNNTNTTKHKISFDEASKVFFDNESIIKEDIKNEYGEKRFNIIGAIIKGIIYVVYTFRGSLVRIISARKANQKERNEYYENIIKNKI